MSTAPLPLGFVRGVERARELRDQEGLSYTHLAVVMRLYHGVTYRPETWRRFLRQAGSPPQPRGRAYSR